MFLKFQFNDRVNVKAKKTKTTSEDKQNYKPPTKKSKLVSTTKEKGKQKKAKNNQEQPKKVSILSQIVKFDVRLVCICHLKSAGPGCSTAN